MTIVLNGETLLIPIIGDPIIYAKSPEWMSATFNARGQNCLCVPMQVRKPDLGTALAGLSAMPNVTGLLVTMPHKSEIFHHCATVSERSRLLEAVSVMRRNPDGGWHGDILDGKSFVQAQINHGAWPQGGRALLLGAGGAGSAIGIAFIDAGLGELVIHDVDADRSEKLARKLRGLGKTSISTGGADPTGFDMLCNATPLGMADSDPLPIDASQLRPDMFVGDVIAGHGETALLRAARKAGCRTANGDQMVEAVLDITADFFFGT